MIESTTKKLCIKNTCQQKNPDMVLSHLHSLENFSLKKPWFWLECSFRKKSIK